MPFPSPPWSMRGEMWLSLFAVRNRTSDRPAGLYGAAFVDYREGSALTYHELVVARLVREGAVARVRVTDIWVDSAASRGGGRALWALPKDLAQLDVTEHTAGPRRTASGEASVDGSPVAAARFAAVRMPVVRAPFAFTVSQVRESGASVVTPVSGSARTVPARARWDFDAAGPLGWLGRRRPVASFRVGDFRLTFGG